ncbi:TetR/AcrR family transcriptional regulator, partial [Phaeobacter italicus]
MSSNENRDKLIRTASRLFRSKGYDGVGLKEILAAADLPKGSLYYHFPGGKVELADAATRWAGDWVA